MSSTVAPADLTYQVDRSDILDDTFNAGGSRLKALFQTPTRWTNSLGETTTSQIGMGSLLPDWYQVCSADASVN